MLLKKSATLFLCVLSVPMGLSALTGRDIAESVDNRPNGSSSHTLVQMELTDKNGSVNTRVIEEYSMDSDDDLGQVVIVFHSPASVKNTRFLVMEKQGDADDDKWIYLPALQRVRRIAASEGDQSFMGTDFSYDDMSSIDIDEYEYSLLREETLNGIDCYVVEAVPLDPEDKQYSKLVSWVQKDSWVNRKVEMYDKKGDLLKTLETIRVETVQGYETPIETKMTNVQDDHSTVLTVQKVKYDEKYPSGLFSTRFLQSGRP